MKDIASPFFTGILAIGSEEDESAGIFLLCVEGSSIVLSETDFLGVGEL